MVILLFKSSIERIIDFDFIFLFILFGVYFPLL